MIKTLLLGMIVGGAAGFASVMILQWLGIEVTPAIATGAIGGAVGSVVTGAFCNQKDPVTATH